jgi:hypothetical protein
MDIEYVVSYAFANFYSKIQHFVPCAKKTNNVQVVYGTIHSNLIYFAQATYGHILGQNLVDTQDTT